MQYNCARLDMFHLKNKNFEVVSNDMKTSQCIIIYEIVSLKLPKYTLYAVMLIESFIVYTIINNSQCLEQNKCSIIN